MRSVAVRSRSRAAVHSAVRCFRRRRRALVSAIVRPIIVPRARHTNPMMAIAGHRMPDPELRTDEAWSMVCTTAGTVIVVSEVEGTAGLTTGAGLTTAVGGADVTGATELGGGTVATGVTAVVATGGGTTGAADGTGERTTVGEGAMVGVGVGVG